ncbi:hypothetical protein EWM64_g2654 [Hericium alpestre]|uniref:J domain-containing protein n=1 Tax=Hericium alpestre TaxID=135208 RepID=A0A4Z0A2U4_9AGAM|nr:hypothetical protein EWM64_g2654 [Hericium alpestre]
MRYSRACPEHASLSGAGGRQMWFSKLIAFINLALLRELFKMNLDTERENMIIWVLIIVGWYVFPPILTYIVLFLLKPFLSSPKSPKHYRTVIIASIVIYIIFNLIRASRSTPTNYYERLGVSPEVDLNGLKQAFRRFVKRNHPDHAGPEATDIFIDVKDGYDALTHPKRRWAYERFGPTWLRCQECEISIATTFEGIQKATNFHIITLVILLVVSALGQIDDGMFWHYLSFFALVVSEVVLVLCPSSTMNEFFPQSSHILSYLFPGRVIFQHRHILRELFIISNMALWRLVAVFNDDEQKKSLLAEATEAVAGKIQLVEKELTNLLRTEMNSLITSRWVPDGSPPVPDAETMHTLTQEMHNYRVEKQLDQQTGDVAYACKESLRVSQFQTPRPAPRRRVAFGSSHAGSFSSSGSPYAGPSSSSSPFAVQTGSSNEDQVMEDVAVLEERQRKLWSYRGGAHASGYRGRSKTLLGVGVLAAEDRTVIANRTIERTVQLRTHSIYAPYIDQDLQNRWWDFGADAYVNTNKHVRLARNRPSQMGWLWSRLPITASNFIIEVEFKISGDSSHLYGDGMAFWLTKERAQPGPVFGSIDKFNGLGIFMDTYANARHGYAFPRITAMLGDGKTEYDLNGDGDATSIGACSANIRRTSVTTKLKVTYVKDTVLDVKLQYRGWDDWSDCFTVNGISLPDSPFVGMSAMTGDVSDNHDIISVSTYSAVLSAAEAPRNKMRPFGSGAAASFTYTVFKLLAFVGVVAGAFLGYREYSRRKSDPFGARGGGFGGGFGGFGQGGGGGLWQDPKRF